MNKKVRDIPDKEEPKVGPYWGKKGPHQPQQGGRPKEKTESGR